MGVIGGEIAVGNRVGVIGGEIAVGGRVGVIGGEIAVGDRVGVIGGETASIPLKGILGIDDIGAGQRATITIIATQNIRARQKRLLIIGHL